jgi:hypothetical protein
VLACRAIDTLLGTPLVVTAAGSPLLFTAADEGKAEGTDVKEEEGEQTEAGSSSKGSSPNKWSRPAPLKVGKAPAGEEQLS